MKRILFDVPRWHCYLHRDSRGLDRVELSDGPTRRFEDELFDRLYSGDGERLPEADQERSMKSWAEQVHATTEQLPAFARLASEVRGDALAAGAAVETLMEALKPEEPEKKPEQMRRALAQGCEKASAAVENLRDTIEGVDGVAFGQAAGSGSAEGGQLDQAPIRSLAARLKNDERLRRIALLAGRFKRIAAAKRRQRLKHGADEISDIGQGADLARLLPSEMVRLLRPRLRLAFLRAFTERQCLQYELTGSAVLGKGPLVVCLDKSGSMRGDRDLWATAVALALLDQAQHERRPFVLLGFDGKVKFEAIVQPGQPMPEAGLFVGCAGGTDIGGVIEHGLGLIRGQAGKLRRSDIVLVTDGQSDPDTALVLREQAKTLDVTILGLGIGVEPEALSPWCDEAHAISSLDRIDEKSAEAMFAR